MQGVRGEYSGAGDDDAGHVDCGRLPVVRGATAVSAAGYFSWAALALVGDGEEAGAVGDEGVGVRDQGSRL